MTQTTRTADSLQRALNAGAAELVNASPDDFDSILRGVLQRAGELGEFVFAAVLGGSIREGSCGWAASESDGEWCDDLHGALFDEAGDAIFSNDELVFEGPGSMGEETAGIVDRLGARSMLVLRLRGDDQEEAALVLGSQAERSWGADVGMMFSMLGSVVTGMALREREESVQFANDAELQRSRNLGAISKLSGTIAHDINDMLVPIIGHTESMLQSEAENPGLAAILESAKGAADLTKQLLAFSQKQMLVKKPTDIAACLRGLRETLGRVLGEDIEIVDRAPESPWCVQADRGQLQQVVMNLCTNARDAMDGKGRIEVSVENVAMGQDGEGYVSGDFVRFQVRDSGCGIARECYDHVFEPFQTTKGRAGAGLGLSVAQGIVEQHGGWMDLESEIGQGSTFSVYLPAERAAVPEENVERRGGRSVEGARVLLVDDEPSVVKFIEQILGSKGYAVTTAESRAEAFEVLNRSAERFDLVFTDAMLPDGTGMDVVQRGRSIDPEVSALLSSGYSDDRSLLARAEAEGVDFLSKPYSLEELLSAVENALGAELVA